jgi:hypothetical protein
VALNDVRATIETRILAAFPDIPVFFGNTNANPPNDLAWLWCAVNFGDGSYETMDGLDWQNGVVSCNIFTPVGTGTEAGFTLADRLKTVFRRLQVEGVYFRPATGPRAIANPDTAAWFQLAVSIQFVAG